MFALLVAVAACGRLGFDRGELDAVSSGDDADIDAFELLREDGGIDLPCTAPLAPDAISVGRHHVCAHNGTGIYCWGGNESGQLGLGDTTGRMTPTLLAGCRADVGVPD